MKKLAIVFGLLIVIAPVGANAQSWRFVIENGTAPDRYVNFIDTDSIRRTDDTVSFWQLEILESPDDTGVIRTTIMVRARCTDRRYEKMQTTYFYSNGRSRTDSRAPTQQYALPGSVLAYKIDTVCGRNPFGTVVADPENRIRAIWRGDD